MLGPLTDDTQSRDSKDGIGRTILVPRRTHATGNVYAFQTGRDSVSTLWNATYDAGSGTDYVDVQTYIKVYNQTSGPTVSPAPVFNPNASGRATDNALLNACGGKAYGPVVLSDYNVTAFDAVDVDSDIDGAWNDMSKQVPIGPQSDGTSACSTRWELPLRVKCVLVNPTKVGMVYAYAQDEESAKTGPVYAVRGDRELRDWRGGWKDHDGGRRTGNTSTMNSMP
ncbi:hypothetical protein PMIN03_010417 [Paraphaeosphaeria minitans]